MTASIGALRPDVNKGKIERLVRFAAVGGLGFIVNSAALGLVSVVLGLHYVLGAAVATVASTASNFLLTERYVFGDRAERAGRFRRFAVFLGLSLATLVARGPILIGLTELAGLHYLLSNALSLVMLMLVRFQYSGSKIWPETTT